MAEKHSQEWLAEVFEAMHDVMQRFDATPDDLACCIGVELAAGRDTSAVHEFRRLADLWEKEGGGIATHGAEIH